MKKYYDIGEDVIINSLDNTGIMKGKVAIGSNGKIVDITRHGNYIVDVNGETWCFDESNLTPAFKK